MGLLLFLLTLFWTIRQKPVYEAKALLEVEPNSSNAASVQDLFRFASVSGDYVETQEKLLQSDSLAREVIRKLRLDQEAKVDSDFKPEESAVAKQVALKVFERRLNVLPIPNSRLVRVTFDSQDPKLAAQVVNTLTATFIERNFQSHWDAMQNATKWLSQQLDRLRIRLEASERDLQRYTQANGLVYVDSGQGRLRSITDERLQQLEEQVTAAQMIRFEKESLFRVEQAGDSEAMPGVFDDRITRNLTERLQHLEQKQAQLAVSFKAGYPPMQAIQSEIKRTRRLLAQQQGEAERHIADEYFAALQHEDLLRRAFARQQARAKIAAQEAVQYNILKREVDTNKQLYDALLQRMKEAGVSAGLRANSIRVVDAAVPPISPVRPKIALDLAFGFLGALGGGLGFACVQERVDNSVKSPEDVAHFLHLPILGLIPNGRRTERDEIRRSCVRLSRHLRVASWTAFRAEQQQNVWVRLDSSASGMSDLRESFRVLRTSILLSTAGRAPRSLAFVSAGPSEGKTTVCCNLAVSLAQLGKRVLLIDGDIRRPGVQDFFQITGSSGLVNYLAGQGEWRNLVQASSTKGLDCLICGPLPPSPGELLSSERMEALIKDAMSDYNFVLVDAPPLLSITDGRVLAATVEATVLVIKGAVTSRERAQRAQACVSAVGAHLIGAVLNQIDLREAGYYQTGYYEDREGSAAERDKASA